MDIGHEQLLSRIRSVDLRAVCEENVELLRIMARQTVIAQPHNKNASWPRFVCPHSGTHLYIRFINPKYLTRMVEAGKILIPDDFHIQIIGALFFLTDRERKYHAVVLVNDIPEDFTAVVLRFKCHAIDRWQERSHNNKSKKDLTLKLIKKVVTSKHIIRENRATMLWRGGSFEGYLVRDSDGIFEVQYNTYLGVDMQQNNYEIYWKINKPEWITIM